MKIFQYYYINIGVNGLLIMPHPDRKYFDDEAPMSKEYHAKDNTCSWNYDDWVPII